MKKDIQKNKDDINKKPQNCWEFWGCADEAKKKCAVFQENMGRSCWLLSEISQKTKSDRKEKSCFECEWYKKLNPCEENNINNL